MDYPVHGVSWTLLSILSFLTFSQCLNDGTPDVRDAAFSALAAIAKLVGMRPLERSLEKLDDVRRKKLSETKQKQNIFLTQ
ncbi:protein MOR1-like [Humulus lupulus]|uniref:protein MOR1-like n=1 Tax=Humulus lupulus TaxID=3486 RepID=UPI002B414CEA|nr:protein MOR1-like [Humulus lupulus]